MPIIALIVLALGVGILIGGVGVGGVALPPFLTWFAGFDPHTAAGTSSLAFIFTGLVGTAMYARHASMSWRLVGWLSLGAVPAAFAGAWTNGFVPDAYAMVPLALLVTGVGIRHLWSLKQSAPGARARGSERPLSERLSLRPSAMLLTGAAVGFASALTGTGGPVFLVPALLMLRVPALTAIAVAQVVQLPLVASAVSGYARQGAVDYGTGVFIGVLSGIGVVVGASIAMRLPRRALSLTTGFALAGFGVLLLGSSAWALLVQLI